MIASPSQLVKLRRLTAQKVRNWSDPIFLEWLLWQKPRIQKFKDCHQGEDCFIIGNGPSLRKMDLTPLRNYHTFGLNKIYLIFDQVDLDLSYHVAINKLVIQQSVEAFSEQIRCPSFLSMRPAYNVVPRQDRIYRIYTSSHRIYIDPSVPALFQPDASDVLYEGYTVTYVAMQIAYYMGFRRIFLIGVDHSFSSQGKPNEVQTMVGEDPNHFAPNYFGNQPWNLPDLHKSEMAYTLARERFAAVGRGIYDATVDGKLTIFPKLAFADALSTCSRKSNH